MNAETLRSILHYDPATGVFHWTRSRTGNAKAGVRAGSMSRGYLRIRTGGKLYQAHRLAWLYVHGEWPKGAIDHINGITDDNRICNLREASVSENQQNQRKPQASNKSGFLGVSWSKSSAKWLAKITVAGKSRYLGYFATPEEAHAAYLRAKAEIHPFQTISEAKP